MSSSTKGHYLLLQLTVKKGEFERLYLPLVSVDETVEEATERWLDSQVVGRQRNIERARRAAEARIELSRLCRPSSWRIAQRDAEPPKAKSTSRRKKA